MSGKSDKKSFFRIRINSDRVMPPKLREAEYLIAMITIILKSLKVEALQRFFKLAFFAFDFINRRKYLITTLCLQ